MAANSRTNTARKTAARPARAPRDLTPVEVESIDDELDAADAQEIEAHAATSDGYITVPMTGGDGDTEDVRVLLSSRWRASAMRAINQGDFDGFMRKVLFEDDYEVYVDLDPDAEEVQNFATAVVEATGEPSGKSSGSTRSRRSTRRS